MIKLTKGADIKILSEESSLIDKLLSKGWKKEAPEAITPEKKEVKNGKSSKSGS